MLALKNAQIHTVIGKTYKRSSILIDDQGLIKSVGSSIEFPKETQVIDCNGLQIYPGFVEAHCHIGLNREGLGSISSHANESTNPFTPDMRAFDALDCQDMHFHKALHEGGVTAANVSPGSANVIGGSCDVISVKPSFTAEDLLLKESIALKMAFGENPFRVYGSRNLSPSTRMAIPALLRQELTKAINYRGKKEESKKKGSHFDLDLRLEVLCKLLDGSLTAHCHAHETIDIMTAIRVSKEYSYPLVLVHGTESARIASKLAKTKTPVILGPQGGFNAKIENRHRSLKTAAILFEEGVEFSISTDHPVIPLRDLRVEAAKMVNNGLPREAAIRSLTTIPAKILGLDKVIGAIEPNMRADLIVWDGDPLDVSRSRVRHAIVGGELQDPSIGSSDWIECQRT